MSRLLPSLLAFVAFSAFAGERQLVWPKGKMPNVQPHQVAIMVSEADAPGYVAAEHVDPYLEWYDPPENPNGTCVILISGGGYGCCCDEGLVEAWRKAYTAVGVQCVNFVYRTPRPNGLPIYRSAWEDGQRAVRVVRSEASSRGFDPEKIGAASMSAGSHLATLLATTSLTPAYAAVDELDEKVGCHLNFVTAFAIAYGMTDGLTGRNVRRGEGVDVKLDLLFAFDAKTCPMFMSHGGDDPYSPLTSTHVYRRLREMKIPAELHLYPDKPHGMFGLDRAIEFVRQLGFLGPLEPEVELLSRFASDECRASCERFPLWPEGKMPDVMTNQCLPYLEWHMPKTLKTKAIQVVWSGGGYNWSDPESFEVAPIRRYLNEKGMAVVTVKYRHPRPVGLAKHVTAWQDAVRAIRLVKAGAKARGLDSDRVGVMGSSAGGHLALMTASSSRSQAYLPIDDFDKIKPSVAWAVEIYPAYALTDGLDVNNRTGGNADSAVLAPEFAFDPDTPPMLFIHGDADGWAAMNSVKAWEKLRRMGIQSELHTLVLRNHCFHRKASPGTGSYTWSDRVWDFLSVKGFNR